MTATDPKTEVVLKASAPKNADAQKSADDPKTAEDPENAENSKKPDDQKNVGQNTRHRDHGKCGLRNPQVVCCSVEKIEDSDVGSLNEVGFRSNRCLLDGAPVGL